VAELIVPVLLPCPANGQRAACQSKPPPVFDALNARALQDAHVIPVGVISSRRLARHVAGRKKKTLCHSGHSSRDGPPFSVALAWTVSYIEIRRRLAGCSCVSNITNTLTGFDGAERGRAALKFISVRRMKLTNR